MRPLSWRTFAHAGALGLVVAGGCAELASIDEWQGSTTTASSAGGAAGSDGGVEDSGSGAGGGGRSSGGGGTAVDASGAYFELVMDSNPLAYWRFDEPSGVIASDVTGNGHHASYIEDVQFGMAGAVPGNSAIALGRNAEVVTTLENAVDFEMNKPFSVECWIDPSGVDSVYRHVISKETFGELRSGYAIFVRHPDGGVPRVGVELFRSENDQLCSAGRNLAAEGMTHVVVTFDGTTVRLYANNQVDPTPCDPIGLPGNDAVLRIGQPAGATGYGHYLGVVDEVAIYPKALSEAEVAARYNAVISAR